MRLFVAMDVNDEVRDAADALQAGLRALDLPAKYERREKHHLTIAFLGATAPERFESVAGAIRAAAAASAPFSITLDKLGAFPNERRPRILWFGSSAASPQFDRSAKALRESLARLGWTFDNQAVPHVTICRLKATLRGMPRVAAPRPAQVDVRAYVLYESLPDRTTTRYEERLRVPLGTP